MNNDKFLPVGIPVELISLHSNSHENSYWGITIERCFPAGFIILVVPNDELTIIVAKACRTRELSAEQKFTREHWRK